MSRHDINVGIRLKDGELVEVIYPNRVFREYETPWLDRKGAREMNIDPREDVANYGTNRGSRGARFIIGTSKVGGYGESDNVVRVIPVGLVMAVEPLPADKVAIGQANMQAEENERIRKEQENPERYIRLKELQPILERLAALESKRDNK